MSEEIVAPDVVAPAVADTSAETTSPPAAETTEVDSGAVPTDPEQDEADKALKRGKNWYGRKIDTLTRTIAEERAERRELMEILKRQTPTPQQMTPQAQPPQRSQYSDIEDFFAAQAKYHAENAAAQRVDAILGDHAKQQQQATLQRQAREVVEAFNKRLGEGRKSYADFDDVVGEATDIEVGNAAQAIAEADNPAGVMYFLAKNPERAGEIASMSPSRAALAIGRIDGNLTAKPQVSNAPAPGKPVGSRPSATGDPPDDPTAYMAWRKKHMR